MLPQHIINSNFTPYGGGIFYDYFNSSENSFESKFASPQAVDFGSSFFISFSRKRFLAYLNIFNVRRGE